MRVVLVGLLTLAATSANAGWVKVGGRGSDAYYIDPATIQKEGNIRKAQTLTDLKVRGRHGELSRRSLDEYDCNARRRRVLSLTEHSGQMGDGNVLVSDQVGGKWYHVQPDTAGGIKLNAVCR
ncbi:MAG TPA: surface-adhesin E family protein [Burkholderiales bacterium]|nr:surface-adhesin E family protein [Burkholderiales bacterium]